VQVLGRLLRKHGSTEHRADLERTPQNLPTSVEQWRIDVNSIELRPPIDEIMNPEGRAALLTDRGIGVSHCSIVGVSQRGQFSGWQRSGHNAESVICKLAGRFHRQARPSCNSVAEEIVHCIYGNFRAPCTMPRINTSSGDGR